MTARQRLLPRSVGPLGHSLAAVFTCLLVPGAVWADPQFAHVGSDPFGLSNVGNDPMMCQVDIDGDGDLDIFVGERFGNTFFFENTGSATSPAFAASVNADTFGLTDIGLLAAPTFGDLDGDGDLDAINGLGFELRFFQNTGNSISPAFGAPVANPFGLDSLVVRQMILTDLDGDGDLDLFGVRRFVPNTGNPTVPAFGAPVDNPFGTGTAPNQVLGAAVADIDGDGDLDYFSTDNYGITNFYRNSGSPVSPAFAPHVQDPFGLTLTGGFTTPSMGDLDGDGDCDLFLNRSGAPFFFYENTDPGVLPGGITLVDPAITDNDTVLFKMNFLEPVTPSFSSTDLVAIGTLGAGAQFFLSDDVADPEYHVSIRLNDPDANGTIGVRVSGVVVDASGDTLPAPYDSALYTISNFPPGDVSKNGTFDVSDIALMADANLGLAVLP